MKKTALLTSLSATAMILGATVASAETWDLPMAYSGSNFHSVTGAEFGKCVTTGTGGEITVKTHPGGSLFKGSEIKRAVQTGMVPIGERLLSGHQNEDALFGIDSVPFLATSYESADKLWNAAKPEMEKLLAEQNLTLLYSVLWPAQGLYFKNEVKTPEDMKGVAFRSYNTASARMTELLGMRNVSIEAAEISQAFAMGVAEGMVSSGATGYGRKVWETLNYFYSVDAWLPRNYMLVNSEVWAGVSESNKAVVKACADFAEYAGTWRSKEYTSFTLQGLRDGGMTVEGPSPELKAKVDEVGEIMTSEWLEQAGEKGKAIVDAYLASK
ncbi:TRAP transporter substrate-binding protein [Polycladidibacter hongkongensis]|uniref:TRAP transporter substrate-binding protein n=1 Tax=Polycladidibacter hongkongensis TaxID=1647556 RepID=UPI000834BFE1|nr:TRAP transporter substrate-binding protein [Pseudovibrio hongkongensis]